MDFSADDRVAPGAGSLRPRMEEPSLGGEAVEGLAAPLLSFVVVNWNYARFLGQTLDSIRGQDYGAFECIVVDNGSTDDSLEVVERHVGADGRFRVVALPENLGQLGGAFVGLAEAAGAFVALIDADDVLLPSFASVHIQVHLALQENVAITSSNIVEVDSDDRALSSSYAGLRPGPRRGAAAMRDEGIVVRLPAISSAFYRGPLTERVSIVPRETTGWLWSPGTSNVMRRSVAGMFAEQEQGRRMRAADNYFFKLCHAFAGTAVIDLPLSTRRIHGSNYFACRETMPGFSSGPPEFAGSMQGYAVENLRAVLRHAGRNGWMLHAEFWNVLDRLTEQQGRARRRWYRQPAVVAAFREAAGELRETFGAAGFLRNVRRRFGFRDSLAIARAGFGGPVPARHYGLLLPWPSRKALSALVARWIK